MEIAAADKGGVTHSDIQNNASYNANSTSSGIGTDNNSKNLGILGLVPGWARAVEMHQAPSFNAIDPASTNLNQAA